MLDVKMIKGTTGRQGGNGHAETEGQDAGLASAPKLQTRNTLFIGAGGTGQAIGVNLKAYFIANYGKVPDWVRIRVFDTANEPLMVQLPDGRRVSLEMGTEFINIGHVPVGKIMRHRERQRAINERFGESLMRLPPTVLLNGAKQVRLLGLLALYWHSHKVEEVLERAIWHLAGRDNQQRDVATTQRGLNVFIANSLCGGTGAGAFIDLAFWVRDLVAELGDMADFCQITGVGLLPGAFHGIEGPNLEANTVASLIELNHVMTRGDFHASYPTGRVIDAQRAPFNLYYLLDGIDEHGRVWPGVHAVCQLAAQALYLQMASQLGRKGENDFDNVSEVIGGVTRDGAGTFFGSVGLSVCHFDAQAAFAYCARRHALRMIREGWLRAPEADRADGAAAAFFKSERLAPDLLTEDLSVDEQGVPLSVDLTLPGRLRRLPVAQQAHETVAHVEEYWARRLHGTFRNVIEAQSRAKTEAVIAEADRTIAERAGSPKAGVAQARAAAQSLTVQMDEDRRALKERFAEIEAECEEAEGQVDRRRESLLRAALAGFLLRGARVGSAQRQYIQAAHVLYDLHLDRELVEAALRVVDRLSQRLSELDKRLERLAARLHEAGRLLAARQTTTSSLVMPADLELFDADYGAVLYERHAPSLSDTALRIRRSGELLEWADLPADELVDTVREAAGQDFRAVRDFGVEAVLAEQAGRISPEARHQSLMNRAIPSWNLDRSRLEDGGAGLVPVDVLGVPDKHQTLFTMDQGALVSTQDEREIIALRALVGAPYTALQQMPAWKREYDDVRGRRLLHVLPAFHSSTDQAIQAFALGLIFKLITTQGSWYYYQPADKLEEPQRLAQGLGNAVKIFAGDEARVREVLDRVERQISVRMTTRQAIERLDAYWAAGEGQRNLDEIDRRLRKAVRDYADELRKVLSASEGIVTDEPQ